MPTAFVVACALLTAIAVACAVHARSVKAERLHADPRADLKDALRRIPNFSLFSAGNVEWLYGLIDRMPLADARRTAEWLRKNPRSNLAYVSAADVAFHLDAFKRLLTPKGRALVASYRASALSDEAMDAARSAILGMTDDQAARAERWFTEGVARGLLTLRHHFFVFDEPLYALHRATATYCTSKEFFSTGAPLRCRVPSLEALVEAFTADLRRRVVESTHGISDQENEHAAETMDFLIACIIEAKGKPASGVSDAPPKPVRPDDYAKLGLPPGTPFPEVTKRFRELSKSRHPDVGGDGIAFLEISCAYERIKSNE